MGVQNLGPQSRLFRVRHLLEVVVAIAGVLVPGVEGVVMVAAQSCPDEPSNIPSFFAVEVDHAPQSVCVKDDAPENISFMLITLDTSHLEMSPLNDGAWSNIQTMLATLDTSHLEMS